MDLPSLPKVIAVLVIDTVKRAVPLAECLLENGVHAMELTLRTPAALDALTAIRKSVPYMLTGVGTILTPEQVRAVKVAGAAFGVSPGMNRRVLEEAANSDLPFAPGIATPSDIEASLEYGCRILKFFPAEASGGLPYLKSMAAPYAHLGLGYIPLGGINEANLGAWLEEPLIHAVGGSWIAPREMIRNQQWEAIGKRAAAATRIAANCEQKAIS